MVRLATALLIICCLGSTPAAAQDTASVDAFAALPSSQPVVVNCIRVSEDPEIADPENGICVTAARAYVSAVQGLDAVAVDAALRQLVEILAELPRGTLEECRRYRDEIAQAIIILSESSSTREFRGQILQIAQSLVEDCGITVGAIDGEIVSPQ
ncbi:hypothetical protein [Devosia sp. CN2-171]|uniref:hypothetical protein n=1 Tax=Devosia sp. CN2-171 TaxID=3400909 RepID=UPI003BF771C9